MLAAAVDDYWAHAYGAHEGDVFENAFVNALFGHSRAAVFDDYDAVLEFLDVRKRLDEDFGLFDCFLHCFYIIFLYIFNIVSKKGLSSFRTFFQLVEAEIVEGGVAFRFYSNMELYFLRFFEG